MSAGIGGGVLPGMDRFDKLLDAGLGVIAQRDQAQALAVDLEQLCAHYETALRDIAASTTGEGLYAQAALDKAAAL